MLGLRWLTASLRASRGISFVVSPAASARHSLGGGECADLALGLHRLDDLPEILLQGREREFLTWLFRAKSARPWTITPDLAECVRVNAAPGATRAALSYQRHMLGPEGIAHSRARAERKLAMPILAFGAEAGGGTTLPDTMALIAEDVRGGLFAGCGHYVAEEAPRAVAEQIIRFMGK